MNTIASRFLSFEEPLGAGLVKFAYFVIALLFAILLIVTMIGGIVAMFQVGFLAGLGQFLLAPVWFALAMILLRVATEVVLAILSIDDNLTDGARTGGAMPIPSPKQAMSGGSGGLPKSPDTSVTEASKDQNQRAPFTRGADGKDVDTSETEASKDENQEAPLTRGSGGSAASAASASSASAESSGGAKSVSTAPAPKASARKAPARKTATKKATKKTASSPASGDADTANATASEAAKKTAEAAKAATRPSASDDKGGAS